MSLLALRPQATLQIDLGAVTANVRTIRSRTAGELMAVVKADGFGHGQVDVARAALAGGATRFGVTSIDEARPLRAAGLTEPILSWLNPPGADFAAAVRLDIELGVPGLDHLHAITRTAPGARIHLQLDTGLGRDGAEPGLSLPKTATPAMVHLLIGLSLTVAALTIHLLYRRRRTQGPGTDALCMAARRIA